MRRVKSEQTAEEIAARAVDERRREEGRTPNRTTSGTGNPKLELSDRTKQQLHGRAKELEIEGRSQMNERQPVAATRERE